MPNAYFYLAATAFFGLAAILWISNGSKLPDLSAWLVSLRRNVPATTTGPNGMNKQVELLVEAGKLWISAGRGDLAQEAFDLAVKSAAEKSA